MNSGLGHEDFTFAGEKGHHSGPELLMAKAKEEKNGLFQDLVVRK